MSIIGIENEFGITARQGDVWLDPTMASTAVVNADLGAGHPAIGAASAARSRSHVPLPDDLVRIFLEESSYANRMLVNGARFYVDHGHPEYSGPETRSARDAVLWDQAGDLIARRAARSAGERLGAHVRLYKNNTDSKGASYGCHENHLVPREVPFEDIVAGFTAYSVSRILFTGAGRVGLGQAGEREGFQLSQRADFFEALVGLETTVRRPIINTRDEPHATRSRWRRLHVITGDALVGEYSTWLKVGTASAVLEAIAAGRRFVRLADPLAAFTAFSHDPTLTATALDDRGRSWTALDLQRHYLEQVVQVGPTWLADAGEVVAAWGELLEDAATDPARLVDRVDWAAKHQLAEGLRTRLGSGWGHPRLAALDLQWAELDSERGLALKLQAAGRLRPVLRPGEAERACLDAPADTRAALRGALLRRFAGHVLLADWSQVTLLGRGGRPINLLLDEPLAASPDGRPGAADVGWIADLPDVAALLASWRERGGRLTAS